MNEILAGFKSDLEIENSFFRNSYFSAWLTLNKELHYSFKIAEEYLILALKEYEIFQF